MGFRKAEVKRRFARISIQGPSASGKTTTALRLARGLVGESGRVAVIDSERGRSDSEADRISGGFDVSVLTDFTPEGYLAEMRAAAKAGYDVLIIDSISHEWEAVLEAKDAKPRNKQFVGWGELTPRHNGFLKGINAFPGHVIVTIRSKTKYVLQEVERNGKTQMQPVKLGLEPVARGGTEYEFDLAFELDQDSKCWLNKRPRGLFGLSMDQHWVEPGEDLGAYLAEKLSGGSPTQSGVPDASEGDPVESSLDALRTGSVVVDEWAESASRQMLEWLEVLGEQWTVELIGPTEMSPEEYLSPENSQQRGRDATIGLFRRLRAAVNGERETRGTH